MAGGTESPISGSESLRVLVSRELLAGFFAGGLVATSFATYNVSSFPSVWVLIEMEVLAAIGGAAGRRAVVLLVELLMGLPVTPVDGGGVALDLVVTGANLGLTIFTLEATERG